MSEKDKNYIVTVSVPVFIDINVSSQNERQGLTDANITLANALAYIHGLKVSDGVTISGVTPFDAKHIVTSRID